MRSRLLSAFKGLGASGLFAASVVVHGQSGFPPQGGEYPIAGLLRGEQVFPHASAGASGGYLVWQDNATDGDDAGVSARRLDSNLSGAFGVFRVNEQGTGPQQNPKVSLLKNGGAVFVWQGGSAGSQDIFARFLARNGTFVTGDVRVNTFTLDQQIDPSVATLANGDVVVAWSSHGQDGSMQGVFGQRFSEGGQRIGVEFQVNQYASFNQRSPSVTGLENGTFVIVWASEQKRFQGSVDIYGRVFGDAGLVGSEFLVNTGTNICANPVAKESSDGGFLVGWSERDVAVLDNAWDIWARPFAADGRGLAPAGRVNTHLHGNHFAPQIASVGPNNLVVWTSEGQDGSREGVFGRFIGNDGAPLSAEFKVNTFSGNRQIQPAVTSDGRQFLVVWSSFIGGSTTFDLFGQRYSAASVQPAAPFVSALSANRLSVTWPLADSTSVVGYDLYVDSAAEPITVTGNIFSLGSLVPSSTHSFRLAHRYADGGRSQLSAAATGTTWGSDENLDGLPDDWQSSFWGNDAANWADPRVDSDGDWASNLQEFLAGTDPRNPESVLRTAIATTPQGNFLRWNSQPGFVYQVQTKTDVNGDWTDVGLPRFAAGTTDSMLVEGSDNPAYYRVKRIR